MLPICVYAGDNDNSIVDAEELRKWVESLLNITEVNTLNSDSTSQLHMAAGEEGDFDIEKAEFLIINRGADVNNLDSMGRAPLHSAVCLGDDDPEQCSETIILLVNNGADVNLLARDFDHVGDNHGGTALYEAAYGDNTEAILTLVRLGARLDIVTRQGNTPLHSAAHGNSVRAIVTLVGLGLDVNIRNNNGYTPLHTAAWRQSFEAIRILVQLEAQVDIRNNFNNGVTPLEVFEESLRRGGITDLIKEQIAEIRQLLGATMEESQFGNNIIIIENTNGIENAFQAQRDARTSIIDSAAAQAELTQADIERNQRVIETERPRTTHIIINQNLEIDDEAQESLNPTIAERLFGKKRRNPNLAEYSDYSGP